MAEARHACLSYSGSVWSPVRSTPLFHSESCSALVAPISTAPQPSAGSAGSTAGWDWAPGGPAGSWQVGRPPHIRVPAPCFSRHARLASVTRDMSQCNPVGQPGMIDEGLLAARLLMTTVGVHKPCVTSIIHLPRSGTDPANIDFDVEPRTNVLMDVVLLLYAHATRIWG